MSKDKSKPEEEELSVDFLYEVEGTVDEDLTLDEEEETEETEEETEETDTTEEVEEDETEETEEDEDPDPDETEEEIPLVDSIKQHLGYEVEGEFEDSEEGIQLLVERVKDQATEEALNAYFDRYPDVKELLEYREMGGDPNKFFQTKFPEVNYEEVELKEDDDRQQEQLIRQELKLVRGMSDEEINAEIEDYRNGGILENKAKRSLSALKAKQAKDQEDLIKEQEEEARKQVENLEKHWNSVKSKIKESTSLKGFKIPSKDKDDFFDYLSKPVEEGKSKAMLAHEEADTETRLAIDYLLYKGFNLSDIIDRKAKQKNTETLRKRMKKAKLDRKREEQPEDDYTQPLGTI